MVLPRHQPETSRRAFLTRHLKWFTVAAAAGLILPLLRFTGFYVKQKPRYITVNKNLGPGSTHTDHEFILFVFDTGAIAVSRRCTHLGCRVLFRRELNIIECPCHQSQFTPQGVRLAGPAKDDLQTYPVRVLEDESGTVSGYEVTQ